MERKHKLYASIIGVGVALFATVLATRGVHDSFLFGRTEADSNYHITLSSDNKYANGETTKLITTDSGAYKVAFDYYNCSAAGDAHVILNNEGTLRNSDHILSINSITPVFSSDSSSSLKFRASFDGEKWGEYASLTSGVPFDLDSMPYYVELKAFGGAVALNTLGISYGCTVNPEAEKPAGVVWKLVTTKEEIEKAGEYVIASLEENYALSKTQTANNRSGVAITKNNDTITINDDVEILSLVDGYTSTTYSNTYAFKTTAGKYLNADSNDRLTSKDSVNWYATFNFDMWSPDDYDDPEDYVPGDALIQCLSNNNNSYLVYSSSDQSFSCIKPQGGYVQGDSIAVYKKTIGGAGVPVYPTHIDATDAKAGSYHKGDIFDNFVGTENGLNVTLHYSDGTAEKLSKVNYSYVVKTSGGSTVDTSKGFTQNETLHVTVTDSNGLVYTYDILVCDNPVTSITLNTTSAKIAVEGTTQLVVTSILPSNADDKTITWSSSNSGVASVNSTGLVTGIAAGTATITATANGGSGVTASCSVKVTASGGGGETKEVTFDFTNLADWEEWTSAYAQHVVSTDEDGVFTFASADKQGTTITNMPVSKGGDLYYKAPEDATILSLELVCAKWSDSKKNYYTLNTSTNNGDTYKTTDYSTGESYKMTVGELEDDINALKWTANSTSNQIGIESFTVTLFKSSGVVIPVTGLSISPATKSMFVGDDFSITSTVLPTDATNKRIIWTSSNEGVATVAGGVVTGVSAGTTTITAITEDGGYSSTCVVTVSNKPVTSLTLNKTETSVAKGKDFQLTATINDDATIKTITWESSDSSVATVDSTGKVHGVSEGVTVITATADGGLTATCTITVTEQQETSGEATFTFIDVNANFAETESLELGTWSSGTTQAFEEDRGIQFNGRSSGDMLLTFSFKDSSITITSISMVVSNNKTNTKKFKVFSGSTLVGTEQSSYNEKNIEHKMTELNVSGENDLVIECSGWATGDKPGSLYFKSITFEYSTGGVTPPTPSATLSSISVSGAKTSFTVGDSFVFGGVCTAHYSDGSEKSVTPSEITGYNMSSVGEQTVTVKYTEGGRTETTTYKIRVEAEEITLTDLIVTPSATTFNLGDPFSKPTVTAKYSDGSTLNVTNSATITGYNANTVGKQTITVTYSEDGITLTKTYSIEVIDPEESATGSIRIVPTDFGTSYPGSETSFTKSNFTFAYNTVANMSSAGYIQFKKQVGYVKNSGSINGLRSIDVVITSGKAFEGTLYSGTSIDDLSHTQAVSESGTYYIESGDKFFKLTDTSSYAGYLDSITVNYSTKKVDPTSVYFDTTAMDMTPGETAKLTAKFTPDDCNQNMGLTWTSSNTGIATVSNGTITAKAKGTTTITATSTFNTNFKASCVITVKDIAVTSVSLDTSNVSLSIGATKQLYATINPSNATNQNVTWSSSNTTVASVSSTGLITAKAKGSTTVKVTTEDGSKTASCLVEVTEQTMDKWTIMLYICGADLESDGGYATSDIKEILSTKNKPDDVNIIIQTGGTKSWEIGSTYLSGATKIDATKTQRWHVEGSKLVLDSTLNKANFGSSSTLQSFYTWGTTSYPAEKTGVIFWNHGGGVDGVCWDENYNDDCLSMAECKSALSGAFGSTPSKKLEWVGYDACLMQVQDIADYNAKYFNYMVASEESESGNGWDYDKWLPYVYDGSATSEVLKQICYSFIAEQGTSSDQTLSYLNLAYMDEYKTAWENFATQLKSTLSKNGVTKKTIQTFIKNNVKFYSESGYCGWGNFDAKDLVNKIASNNSYNPGSTYTNAVLTAFSKLVEYSRCGSRAGNSYGLCCVYRVDSNVSYSSSVSSFTNWISFNSSYGG